MGYSREGHPDEDGLNNILDKPYQGTIRGYRYIKGDNPKSVFPAKKSGYYRIRHCGAKSYKRCKEYVDSKGKTYKCTRGSKRKVWNRTSHHTCSGKKYNRELLTKNKSGRIVWASKSENGRIQMYKNYESGKMCPFAPNHPEFKTWVNLYREFKANDPETLNDRDWYENVKYSSARRTPRSVANREASRAMPPPAPKKKKGKNAASPTRASPRLVSPRRSARLAGN
jgi:hypothetical protein